MATSAMGKLKQMGSIIKGKARERPFLVLRFLVEGEHTALAVKVLADEDVFTLKEEVMVAAGLENLLLRDLVLYKVCYRQRESEYHA